jgi:hypothetical protein
MGRIAVAPVHTLKGVDLTIAVGRSRVEAPIERVDVSTFTVPADSAHTAPAIHLHQCCAVAHVRHIEWFHDGVRIERSLFDGVVEPERGELRPDLTRPGLGLELKRGEAVRIPSEARPAEAAAGDLEGLATRR